MWSKCFRWLLLCYLMNVHFTPYFFIKIQIEWISFRLDFSLKRWCLWDVCLNWAVGSWINNKAACITCFILFLAKNGPFIQGLSDKWTGQSQLSLCFCDIFRSFKALKPWVFIQMWREILANSCFLEMHYGYYSINTRAYWTLKARTTSLSLQNMPVCMRRCKQHLLEWVYIKVSIVGLNYTYTYWVAHRQLV